MNMDTSRYDTTKAELEQNASITAAARRIAEIAKAIKESGEQITPAVERACTEEILRFPHLNMAQLHELSGPYVNDRSLEGQAMLAKINARIEQGH